MQARLVIGLLPEAEVEAVLSALLEVLARFDETADLIRPAPQLPQVAVAVTAEADAPELLRALQSVPGVSYVEPEQLLQAFDEFGG